MSNSLPVQLDLDTLHLVLQPVVSLTTRKVVGAEALLRQRDEAGELVTPLPLISALATGLLPPSDAGRLTAWLLRGCAEERARWGEHGLLLWCNLSAAELSRPGLADELPELLASGAGLGVQLPIMVLAEVSPVLRRNLQALTETGARLAVDHVDPRQWWDRFGGGRALDGLQMHAIVVDGAWSRAITAAPEIGADIAALIGDAHRRGLVAVAASVETQAQADRLCAARADQAVGYAFGGPVPPERFASLLPGGRPVPTPRRTIEV